MYEIFSLLGIALSLLRYGTYIRAILRGTTKPHPLTWIGAGLMSGIAFIIQIQNLAGPTLWVTGVVTFFCIGIGVLAIFKGEKRITKSDWISFILALVAIPAWLLTNEPLLALAIVLIIELLNYYPTIRKSYMKPWDEDLTSWAVSALRWLFASLAVSHITLGSLLYPAFITACEIGLVAYLIWRRNALKRKTPAA